MEIKVKFDDQLVKKYHDRGSSPLFQIWWKLNDDVNFPEESWMDFGIVVLGWWVAAWDALLNGDSSKEFEFMDGPYKVTLTRKGQNQIFIDIPSIQTNIETDIYTVGSEIKNALTTVVKYFDNLNLQPNELDYRKKDIEFMTNKLNQLLKSL